MRIFGKKKSEPPSEAFDRGWQFYTRATTLEPPGTIFRIDAAKRRYMVGDLNIQGVRGKEQAAIVDKRIETTLGAVIRFLGIEQISGGGKLSTVEHLSFSLTEAEREALDDMAIQGPLDAFLEQLPYRADNRYFLIREALSADAMTFELTKEQAAMLEANARIPNVGGVGAEAGHQTERTISFARNFPERMRVAFLPEEIKPTRSNLAGAAPSLGLVPVTEVLTWDEIEPTC